MSNEDEIKLVPAMPAKPVPASARPVSAPHIQRPASYMRALVMLIVVYFALMIIVSFLPLSGYMKTLSLILGTLFLGDIHHSIKYHVKHRE
jgi:hypothetical protein